MVREGDTEIVQKQGTITHLEILRIVREEPGIDQAPSGVWQQFPTRPPRVSNFCRSLRKLSFYVPSVPAQFADAANATYPGVYQDFLSAIDVINFDLGSAVAAGCLWSKFDFHDRLLVGTIWPLVVVGFPVITYLIAVRGNGAAGNTAAVVEKIRHKHQTALLLTFLVYSSVSSLVFQTFACETLDDGIEYLRADYRIQCTDFKHQAFKAYAGIMVVVYPVGILLLYAVLLFEHRKVGTDRR